jgi:hypothetical protein
MRMAETSDFIRWAARVAREAGKERPMRPDA